MKIVLTDAQTVLDDIVNADVLNRFGEVESFGLLKYEEVAEKIADADIVVCNKTLLDSHTMRFAKNLKYIGGDTVTDVTIGSTEPCFSVLIPAPVSWNIRGSGISWVRGTACSLTVSCRTRTVPIQTCGHCHGSIFPV